MEIALFWVVFAVVVGVIASSRGRSGLGWFLISVFVSPLLGVILVLALGTPKSDPSQDVEQKKCPACAEWVKREANRCKHCGEVFALTTSAPPANAGAVAPSPGAAEFGRSLGVFVGRNRTAVAITAAVVVVWMLYRQFAASG